MQVDPDVPALEESQMTALAQRADLAALRVAERGGSRSVQTMLAMAGGIAAGPLACALGLSLHPRAKQEQEAIREEQIQGAIADKERSIRHEVCAVHRDAASTAESNCWPSSGWNDCASTARRSDGNRSRDPRCGVGRIAHHTAVDRV